MRNSERKQAFQEITSIIKNQKGEFTQRDVLNIYLDKNGHDLAIIPQREFAKYKSYISAVVKELLDLNKISFEKEIKEYSFPTKIYKVVKK